MKTWEEMAAREFITRHDIIVLNEKQPENEGKEKQLPKWLVSTLKRTGLGAKNYQSLYITEDGFVEIENLFKRIKKIPLRIPTNIIAIAQEKYEKIGELFSLNHDTVTQHVSTAVAKEV
jgi:hypothetical protein